MRVVVWGINYAPEVTGIAPHNVALCEHLEHNGHDVEMVSTFAYYPAWKKNREDENLLYRTDRVAGVRVHRCWHYVPERVTALKRIVHEATFALTSTLRILVLPRPDVYVVVSPPLILGTAAKVVSVIKGSPFVFHVQDLQPDAAVGLGMLKSGWFTRALFWLENFAYTQACRVGGISEEILAAFRRKGVPEEKLILYPNSVVLPPRESLPVRGEFRRKNGFRADEFLGIYAGNLGVKQGLDILLETAELLRGESGIRIILCGDGAAKARLEDAVRSRNLNNVSMLPLQFGRDYEELLADVDISFIPQQTGSGNAFFPSKILVTLAYFCPVLTVADVGSALETAVAKGNFGVNVVPGQPQRLAEVLRELAGNRAQLKQWGEAGRAYVEQFERKRVQQKFVETLQAMLATGA